MRAFEFGKHIFQKFPVQLIWNAVLVVVTSIIVVASLVSFGPVIDFYIHPDLKNLSSLTERAIRVMEYFKVPVSLGSWLTLFVAFFLLGGCCQVLTLRSILKTKYSVLEDLIVGTFRDFFHARWFFFSSGNQGVFLNTFNREATVVGEAFNAMALFVAGVLQLIFYLAVPFIVSWQVTVISLACAVLMGAPFLFLGKISYRWGRLNTSTANAISATLYESLGAAKVILGFGKQKKAIKNMEETFDAHRRATLMFQTMEQAIPVLYRPLSVIVLSVAMFAGRWFEVPLSEMAILLMAFLQALPAIGMLITKKVALDNFFPSFEQIRSLRERAKEMSQKSGEIIFSDFDHKISTENLSFSYPGRNLILSDVSIQIPKGKMIAFVGESGAGKTTLIDILLGFHLPTQGNIFVDGTPLASFDIDAYRHRIGYVTQESILFNMSIRDNLCWADEEITETEIESACQQAHAIEFIRKLPEGLDTIIGDRGVRLSGGQVQRLALARAIIKKPTLLILDEATSSLDTESERLIQEAIEDIAKNTTVVVIAHRLSTIVKADYVYVLNKGRVVEQGAYEELSKSDGYFNRMVAFQSVQKLSDIN